MSRSFDRYNTCRPKCGSSLRPLPCPCRTLGKQFDRLSIVCSSIVFNDHLHPSHLIISSSSTRAPTEKNSSTGNDIESAPVNVPRKPIQPSSLPAGLGADPHHFTHTQQVRSLRSSTLPIDDDSFRIIFDAFAWSQTGCLPKWNSIRCVSTRSLVRIDCPARSYYLLYPHSPLTPAPIIITVFVFDKTNHLVIILIIMRHLYSTSSSFFF